MSSWKKYSLIVAILLVLIGLSLVALLVPGDGVTRLIAVFAIFLNFGKAAYDILKKESEGKESVKATPVCASSNTVEVVGVELYNAGSAPVAIKRVALVVNTDTGELSEYLPSESEVKRLENGPFQEASTLPESVSRVELGSKKHVRFQLDRDTEWTIGRLLQLPADSFWIEVESFMGEVARVSGKDIQAAILNTPYGKAIRAVREKLEELSA